jgi:hypothetical protein
MDLVCLSGGVMLIINNRSVAPTRSTSKNEAEEYICRNSDPLPPFRPKTFKGLSDILKLHPGGCVRNEQYSQVSKLVTAKNITCESSSFVECMPISHSASPAIYMENLSHREYWIRLFVVFDAETRTTTSLLLHLLPRERNVIEQKLSDNALYPLTLHPLFVPTLVIELLFQETTEYLNFAFSASIGMYIAAGLHDSAGYRHYQRKHLDMEKAADKSLGHEQNILVLCEKLESNGRWLTNSCPGLTSCKLTRCLLSRRSASNQRE